MLNIPTKVVVDSNGNALNSRLIIPNKLGSTVKAVIIAIEPLNKNWPPAVEGNPNLSATQAMSISSTWQTPDADSKHPPYGLYTEAKLSSTQDHGKAGDGTKEKNLGLPSLKPREMISYASLRTSSSGLGVPGVDILRIWANFLSPAGWFVAFKKHLLLVKET
ncbi:hypothetical protein N7494_002907 [Penicillium frequentans]|uniref:Uncharacterized protein n=1 Tax=Penicillium frequentans TaxID=3151616 RepID=A0AAD6D4S2_9EURO|nr:hypothetical protein N7494_002907 [Penicillium glabrum]